MDGRDRPRAHAPPTDVLSTPRPRKEYERAQSGIKKGGKARALPHWPAPSPPPYQYLFVYLFRRSLPTLPRPVLPLDSTATAGRCSSSLLLLLRPYPAAECGERPCPPPAARVRRLRRGRGRRGGAAGASLREVCCILLLLRPGMLVYLLCRLCSDSVPSFAPRIGSGVIDSLLV